MMKQKELIILIGNLGTGKSTFAKTLVEKGYINISRDSLRYMIGAGKYIFNKEFEQSIDFAIVTM